MLAYTYSKSIDQASSISDIVNPFNYGATRALSAWDLRHNLVATYQYQLPVERLFSIGRPREDAGAGWAISGITRVSSGFPVTLATQSDNSLQGSLPNGVNNQQSGPAGLHAGAAESERQSAQRAAVLQYRRFSAKRAGHAGQCVAALVLRARNAELRSRAAARIFG